MSAKPDHRPRVDAGWRVPFAIQRLRPRAPQAALMRESLLILIFWTLVGCVTARAGTCRAWSEDRQFLTNETTYFQPGSAALNAEAKAKVAEVAHYMETNRVVAVRIEGHGDGRGTERQNYKLGDRRAEALREELVRLGIDSVRVDTIACGRNPQSDRGYVGGAPRKWHRAEFVLLIPPQ